MKIREFLIAPLLLSSIPFACCASDSSAATKPVQKTEESVSEEAKKAVPSSSQGNPLPAMNFYSSVASDTIYDTIKANPRFSKLDKELVGSPITILVTHSIRPTAGGQAAGLLTAMLSGGSLGLIPIVTNEQFVLRYEILLHGKPVSVYSFERTNTRAINLWSQDTSAEHVFGKDGMEWLKSTINEFIAKSANDPELLKIQDEIDFYFNKK